MPQGTGAVGTATNPSPQMPGATTSLKPAMPPTPNSGGVLQQPGQVPWQVPTDPGYKGQLPSGVFGQAGAQQAQARIKAAGGTAQMGGGLLPQGGAYVSTIPDAPANRPQQTERANPLVNGGGTPQVEGTSVPVPAPHLDPGKALGFKQSGGRVAGGQDINPAGGGVAPEGGFVPGDPNAPGGQLSDYSGPTNDAQASRQGIEGDMTAAREGTQGNVSPQSCTRA